MVVALYSNWSPEVLSLFKEWGNAMELSWVLLAVLKPFLNRTVSVPSVITC